MSQNKITKLCQVSQGMKVVLAINGVTTKDAKVAIGTGDDGKARVWFCQNIARGAHNRNAFGYTYAYSVGVNCDGTLRLDSNGITGLREWTAADAALTGTVYTLEDGTRITAADYDATPSSAFAPAGYRVQRLRVVAVEEAGVKFSDGTASAGMRFKTVSKFRTAISDRNNEINEIRANIRTENDRIAELAKASDKYYANKNRYNQFARKFGWAVVA